MLLNVTNLKKYFPVRKGILRKVVGHVKAVDDVDMYIKEGETSADLEYSLETVACIGACGLAPCLTINKQVAAKVTPKRVAKLLRKSGKDGDQSY